MTFSVRAPILPLLCLSTLVGAEDLSLRLAAHDWPPFTGSTTGGATAGLLVETALRRAGISVTRDTLDWRDVLPSIADGTHAGSPALWRSPERETTLLFSNPYLENRFVLVGTADSDVDATSFADLAGKRLAVVKGYAHGISKEDAADVILVEGPSVQENLDRLLAGDVDYMLVDELLAKYAQTRQPEETVKHLAIGSNSLVTRGLHLALRKDVPDAEKIITAFNREIDAMKADGSYNRILGLAWVRADVDGDGALELVANDTVHTLPEQTVYAVTTRSEADAPLEPTEKIWVRGKLYDGWDQVPDSFKVEDDPRLDVQPASGVLFQFSF